MTTHHPTFDPNIAQALAAALDDDPFYRAISVAAGHVASHRAQLLAQYFELALQEAAQVGEVHACGADGAALWLTPPADPGAAAACQAARQQGLRSLLGAQGFQAYCDISAAMARQIPAVLEQAWYLSILGVRPAARGQGLAQRLLTPTLERADRQNAICFLETFNPQSLPFYARLGFGHPQTCIEPVTGRTYWLLQRLPQQSARG